MTSGGEVVCSSA